MKTTALAAALFLGAATALAGPYDPPTAPPGPGTAEWKYHQRMETEASIMYDSWSLFLCGYRSLRWYNDLALRFLFADHQLAKELYARASDPTRFEAYVNTENAQLRNRAQLDRQETPREKCEAALDRVDEFEAATAKWRYR